MVEQEERRQNATNGYYSEESATRLNKKKVDLMFTAVVYICVVMAYLDGGPLESRSKVT